MIGSKVRAVVLILVALSIPDVVRGETESAGSGASGASDDEVSHEYINFRPGERRYDLLPLTQYLNTAFDSAQVSDTFSQEGYFEAHKTMFERISHPFSNIKKDGGYNKIAEREFASARALPNVVLHMVGNGYDFRTLAEWYDHKGLSHPYLWAFATSYLGYFGNEALEVSSKDIDGSDHIADLYVFNLAGNLLFMNDDFARFVHDDLQMRNWTGQPFLDLDELEILNASNNYVFRPDIFTDEIRPFLYIGLHYMAGLSFRLADRSEISVGTGFAVEDPFRSPTDDFADNFKKLKVTGGIFWDRDDRLLASVIGNSTNSYLVRANFYPDILPRNPFDIGVFLGIREGGEPSLGISIHKAFALGF